MTLADRYLKATDPRERDALLAEHVFGLTRSSGGAYWLDEGGEPRFAYGLTFTLADLLDECKRRFPYFIVHYHAERRFPYEAELGESGYKITSFASAEKAEDAVAVALIKAVEAEKEAERG